MLQIGLDTTQIQSKQITAKLREATGGVAHTIASIHLKQHPAGTEQQSTKSVQTRQLQQQRYQ